MEQLFTQIQDVFLNLFKGSEALMATLGQPEIMIAAFVALNIIIFTETGLLIGFLLPGDSLLVTAGIVAWNSDWPVTILIVTLCLSAIIGDSVGYYIGYKSGPRIFTREKSWFFRKDYLLLAQEFYERHGGKTIIIARFVPVIRTFAPVVAGVGQMNYKRFISFNVFGGIGWIASMILLGYVLTPVLDPILKPILGDEFRVQKHVGKVIILVVLVSVAPMFYAAGKNWLKNRKAARLAAAMKPAA